MALGIELVVYGFGLFEESLNFFIRPKFLAERISVGRSLFFRSGSGSSRGRIRGEARGVAGEVGWCASGVAEPAAAVPVGVGGCVRLN